MHSGRNRELSPPSEMVPARCVKIILDGVRLFVRSIPMEKFIRSVRKDSGAFRVSIPNKLIRLKLWGDVKYVLIEDAGPDKIIIRRLIDGKSLKG